MLNEIIEAQVAQIRAAERLLPVGAWYLSFSDDRGFLGAAIVLAGGVVTALDTCNRLGINPGGEVMALAFPEPVFPELMNRLLSKAELVAAFGELERINRHEDVSIESES